MPYPNQALSAQLTDEFPEGGYGWVCVVSIFLINAHTWGINGAFGVILSFYLSEDEFPGTSALVYAAVSGLSISCALVIAPIVTYLTPILPKRTLIILGAFLVSASAQPTFVLFLIWGFFSLLSYISLLFSLASYAQALGLDSNTGSIASALLNLGQAFGRPLVGALSDRFGRIKVPAITCGLCGLLCMAFWPFATSPGALFGFSVLVGLGAGTVWAASASIAAELVDLPRVPGALTVLWLVLVSPGTVAEVVALQLRLPDGSETSRGGYLPVQMFVGATYLAAAAALGGVALLRLMSKRGN